MRLNRKLLAVILTICLMFSIAAPASAATLEVTLGEASYYDIATTAYSRMLLFQNGVVAAANQNKQYGLIDATGKVVVPFQYAGMWTLGKGLFKVSDTADSYGGKQGVIDAAGKEVIAMAENRQIECSGEIIQVRDSQYGSFNGMPTYNFTYTYYTLDMKAATEEDYYSSSSAESNIPPQLAGYDWWDEIGDYYRVHKDNQWAILDKNFRTVFAQGSYDNAAYVSGNIFIVTKDDKDALVDTAGKVIIAAGTYDSIEVRGWGDTSIQVVKDGQRGVVDNTGKVIVPLGDYQEIGGVNQLGYIAAVSYEGRPYDGSMSNIVSQIYKDGSLVKTISGKAVATEAYYRQLVFSTTGELNGMMDINEKVLLSEKYDTIDIDSNGNLVLAVVDQSDWSWTYGLATVDGQRIFEDKYTQMSALQDNNYKLYDGSHYGIMNTSGKTMLPFNYLDMRVYNNSFIELYDGKNYSCADINNNIVVPNSSTPIVLFGSQPEEGNLGYGLEKIYLGQYYEGFVQNLQPFCITTADGLATVYADYTTGTATDRINGVWASNINQDKQFVYRAANGLYGMGTVGQGTTQGTAASEPAPEGPVNPFGDVASSSPYYNAILWAVEKNITAGTSSTTFAPGSSCTRAQIMTFLWRSAGRPAPASQESPFSDVTTSLNADFYNAILWAAEQGIAEGETFAPNDACTRLAAVEFMWRYAGKPEAAAASFSDITGNAAVNWAVEKEITLGTSANSFSPDNSCTRGQIVTFLYRAFAEE